MAVCLVLRRRKVLCKPWYLQPLQWPSGRSARILNQDTIRYDTPHDTIGYDTTAPAYDNAYDTTASIKPYDRQHTRERPTLQTNTDVLRAQQVRVAACTYDKQGEIGCGASLRVCRLQCSRAPCAPNTPSSAYQGRLMPPQVLTR